jgi:hypothetical protein
MKKGTKKRKPTAKDATSKADLYAKLMRQHLADERARAGE